VVLKACTAWWMCLVLLGGALLHLQLLLLVVVVMVVAMWLEQHQVLQPASPKRLNRRRAVAVAGLSCVVWPRSPMRTCCSCCWRTSLLSAPPPHPRAPHTRVCQGRLEVR
jgi:hypothetical protein